MHVFRVAVPGRGRLSCSVRQALLQCREIGAAVVVLGQHARQAHQRLHARQPVLEAFDVLGAISVSSGVIDMSCLTHPFGG